jgi:hypothetical protein
MAFSAWGAFAVSMPNPDAALYLRAADYFSTGQWTEGLSVYRWPVYSLLIAAIMALTGAKALLAAQVANGLLVLGTTTAFIALASRLTNGDKAFVTIATVMIVFQPQLMELRPWVIRDHGYLCFFLTSVYFAVADNQKPSIMRKLALVGSVVLATSFRIEGLYLGLLIAVYYVLVRLRSVTQQASLIAIFIVVTAALLPLIFGIWASGTFKNWVSGNIVPAQNPLFSAEILHRVEALEKNVLNLGSGHGWQAYISVVTGLAFFQIVRALTPIYAVLAFFAFLPHRLLPSQATLPVVWFAAGQLPMFFLFTFITALLDWRYPMAFALMLMFAVVATATASWRELLMARPRAFFVFPTIVIAFAVAWALDIPRHDRLAYYREAADWIRDNVPPESHIWMNEPRIAYFSGHAYGDVAGVAQIFFLPSPDFEAHGDIDVFVVSSHDVSGRRVRLPDLPSPPQLIKVFKGANEDSVQVLVSCPEMKECKLRSQ